MKIQTNKLFRVLTVWVTSLLLVIALVIVVSAQPIESALHANEAKPTKVLDIMPVTDVAVETAVASKDDTGPAIYIIRLTDPPVASYRGGIEGFEATNPAARNETKLDAQSSASLAYQGYLEGKQSEFLAAAENALGRDIVVRFSYQHAFNGLAAELTAAEAAVVAELPGVANVQIEGIRYPLTDFGPQWIGAEGIWDGTSTGGLPGTRGEGVIVGVIDTGQNLDHPSFADIGGDGYNHTNPFGVGNYVGLCDTDPGTFVCNDKFIGYWIFTGETTEDTDGHGSHTASTAAGNYLVTGTVDLTPYNYSPAISGVALHANIIGYDGCDDGGGCPFSALVAAINQTVIDGVDVINYSIGGGTSNPWGDDDALAFLAAADAGIVPVTSAGNSGPGASTVGSPGDAPWLLTVGASTHNRAGLNGLSSMSGGDTTPPADISGKGFSGGHGPAPIVYADDFGDALCLNPFPAGTWTNSEIVVCDRGTNARVAKGFNVLAGGAGGYVLANVSTEESLNGDVHHLPAVHISSTDGDALKGWLATGSGHMATIDGTTLSIDPANGDMMGAFSSRGPLVNAASDIIKPDVTAPGVDVLAAYRSNPPEADHPTSEYGVISGTSMSSPHAAGAAALMKALYPDWSVAEIKSALMSTAHTDGVVKEDGSTPADPFDMGGGRVDLSAAGRAGIVLDETAANFTDADPSTGGDPKTLNLASLGNGQCLVSCSWTRTVSSTQSVPVTWTVSISAAAGMVLTVDPATFVLPAFGTQIFTVTADVSGLPAGQWAFAEVGLSPDGGSNIAEAHFPVAVVPTTGVVPTSIDIDTRRNAGSQLVEGIESIEITDLTITNYGLTQGTSRTDALSQDPTRDDPYDNLNDGTTIFVTVTVPAAARRLVAEVTESTAPDIDLYVGTGSTPSAATEVCSSTTSSFVEYCDVTDPAAGAWWILVQNWAQSSTPPDATTWVYAVVDGDAGNMSVTGPNSVPANTPYDLRVFWDEPAMTAGDHWYGAIGIGSDPGNPENIAVIPVDLERHENDVVKVASVSEATPGMTVSYTITVQPNVTPEDLAYMITDTIPAGMTYVPGSAAASSGSVNVTGNQLTWSGVALTPVGAAPDYVATTNATDPLCDTGFGGYVNLEDSNIFPQAAIAGDTIAFTAFSSGDPINYYGIDYTVMSFTDDCFALFDFANNYGGSPSVPQSIPDPSLPDNVLAAYWHDFEVFYDAGLNHGVSLATAGAPGGVIILEYDDIQLSGGSASVMDFEIIVARAVDDTPGFFEIVYAYDNVSSLPAPATIGVENVGGTKATAVVNNGDPTGTITSGTMICFDLVAPTFDPIVITYQTTVDAGTPGGTVLTNNAEHNTDNPGSMPAVASTDVLIPGVELYLPVVFKE